MTAPLSDKAIALLPCAMCGEVPGRIVELVPGKVWSVGCNQLRHSTQAMSWVSAEDCANSWNRRTPASEDAASHGEDEARVEAIAKIMYEDECDPAYNPWESADKKTKEVWIDRAASAIRARAALAAKAGGA